MGVGVGGDNHHNCVHTHAYARVYDIIGNSNGISQWEQPFAWNYHVYCAYMHMRVCACMCACVWGSPPPTNTSIHPPNHPPTPPSTHPTTHQPPPKGGNTQNSEISIRLELIKIIQFCLKNLYLWTFLNSSRLTLITLDTPHPPAPPLCSQRSRNLKNSIKRIEIIEFRLKICDPWALPHTYRPDMMCRWGGGVVSYPK